MQHPQSTSRKRIYRKLREKRMRNIVLNSTGILLALGGIAWGITFFVRYYRYEITNDATVEQYITPVNTRIAGYIREVRFTEHQPVHEGDTLLVIDDREFKIRLMDAEAALMDAESPSNTAVSAANIRRRRADLEMARLNLSYTVITAPYSGYTGRRTMETGQLLQAGQTITSLIKNDSKWIIANYREMQIGNIYIGQQVKIRVDAIRGRTFKGRVTAISEATGSKYSMLPADNSAGNFVKIQQRIPVRIDFEDISIEDMKKLRAGMMVVTEAVKTAEP
ncbi:MAG: HlyD family secretion protein [Bacteroidales bacterium]|nr:HlyD family secretion protein [Bacteroidales bacterium]